MFIGPSIMIKLLWALYTELWFKYIISDLSAPGLVLGFFILYCTALRQTTEHLPEKLIGTAKIVLSNSHCVG